MKAYPIVPVMQRIGMTQELYPRARPWIIFGAGPISHEVARVLTGEYELLVKYSVMNPITIPDQSPQTMQM